MASERSLTSAREGEDPAAPLREASGLTTRLILSYVEREGGRDAVTRVLAAAGLEGRELELRDEHRWFADAARRRLFDAAAEVLGDPDVARRIGAAAIELNVGQATKLAVRALGSVKRIYSNVARVNGRFNLVHRMEVLALDDGHARIRNVPLPGVPWHRSDCGYNIGLLSSAPQVFGQPAARVRHPLCIGAGASECIYEVSWTDPERAKRAAAAWAAAGVAGLGIGSLLTPGLLPAISAAAAVTAGVAGWKLAGSRRRRWQLLEAQAHQESDVAGRLTESIQDLVSALDLHEVLAKVTGNAQAAVGGSEFALLVREADGIRGHGSTGLPAGSLEALRRWAEAAERLTEAPVLIDDLADVPELAGLCADADVPLRSLCAAPLVFRERSLGALVALAGAPGGFLPRDVELLRSYAAEAAIALTNARLYAALEDRASRDPLTGLRNHREFHETLGRELERCRRYGGRVAVVLFDLDDFKLVNDTGGHAEGDRLLRAFADALSEASRGSDLAFRVGGDEFALILPEPGDAGAATAAERVRSSTAGLDPRIRLSWGCASWPDAGPTKDSLLAAADDDLYAAKRADSPTGTRPGASGSAPERTRLEVLSRLAAKLAPLEDPQAIARAAVAEIGSAFGHGVVAVLRLDPDGMLRSLAAAGELLDQLDRPGEWQQPVDRGVNGRTARTGEATLVSDTRRDPDFIVLADVDEMRSELALPIRVAGEVWGVLNLEERAPGAFGPEDVLFGDTVAAQIGAALHRGRLFAELEAAFMRTLAALSDALEAKDAYTAAHARQVADLAEAVCERLGLGPDERRTVRYAALLHDVGKIAMPTEMLRKPGALSSTETAEMKRHTVIGADLLARIPFFASVHPVVRSAHERWDGAGYPDGLAGERIPLGARIVCACDAYDAMTSDRPYRRALDEATARAELRDCAGTHFDARVVEALLGVLHARAAGVPAA